MANRKSSPQQEEQLSRKKLRKRERRLQEELQEVQGGYTQALDRFKRAEARLQKWATRVQQVEARLAHIRQALNQKHVQTQPGKLEQPKETAHAAAPSPVPSVSMEDTQQEEEMLEAELQAEATEPAKVLPDDTQQQEEMLTEELQAGATPPSAVPSAPSEDVQQEQELLEEELRVAATPPSENPPPISTEEVPAETPATGATSTPTLAPSPEVIPSETPDTSTASSPISDQAPPETTQIAAQPSGSFADALSLAKIARAVAETTEHAARAAMERASEVAARLEQMSGGRHLIQELLQIQSEAEKARDAAQQAERAAQEAEKRVLEAKPQIQVGDIDQQAETQAVSQADQLIVQPTEEEERETQAFVQSEEEAPTGSVVTQAGAQQESQTSLQSQQEVQSALLTTPSEEAPQEAQSFVQSEEEALASAAGTQAGARPQADQPALTEEVPQPTELPAPSEEEQASQAIEEVPQVQEAHVVVPLQEEAEPSSVDIARVEEIEEEEEVVSAVAAMMIADAAAAAAAQAEAIAEATSARVREARHLAMQADQVLEEVQMAIRTDALTGEDAENHLRDAERNVTRAHALLADAEAAEERARRAAMNAEAEAEVAEGMAFAATDREERTFEDPSVSELKIENADDNVPGGNDLEATTKRPAIQPQEQA